MPDELTREERCESDAGFEKKNEMKQASSQEGGKKTTEEKEQNLQNGL